MQRRDLIMWAVLRALLACGSIALAEVMGWGLLLYLAVPWLVCFLGAILMVVVPLQLLRPIVSGIQVFEAGLFISGFSGSLIVLLLLAPDERLLQEALFVSYGSAIGMGFAAAFFLLGLYRTARGLYRQQGELHSVGPV